MSRSVFQDFQARPSNQQNTVQNHSKTALESRQRTTRTAAKQHYNTPEGFAPRSQTWGQSFFFAPEQRL